LIPLALYTAGTLGLTIEGIMLIAGTALGIDNTILQSRKLGNHKNGNGNGEKTPELTPT